MKVFFATDIHGSEICWRKFLNAAAFYKADMVILGGDVTGKVLVPILAMPGYWEVSFGGQRMRLETKTELDEIQRKIRDRGSYPSVMAPEELDALSEEDGSVDRRFTLEMTRGLDRWLDMADGKLRGGDIPCILNGGNDDIWEIDDIIEQSPCVSFAESKVLDIGGFYLASMGWTNPTPWNTFREAPEDVLATKIDAVVSQIPDMGRAVFNFHAPPYGTGLDEAPALATSAASTWPRWAGPTRRRGTPSARHPRMCWLPRSTRSCRRSRTWAGRCSTSTPRPTAPAWTRRPPWTRTCGRRTAARS